MGALHAECGLTHAAVKTVVDRTGANSRAVWNWFDAKNGPSDELLVVFCYHSGHILETVLALAEHSELITAKKLVHAKGALREMLSLIDRLEEQVTAKLGRTGLPARGRLDAEFANFGNEP